METDKRQCRRFDVCPELEVSEKDTDKIIGVVKDFSRQGMRALFYDFGFERGRPVEFKVQRPNRKSKVLVKGDIVWKKQVDDRWETGIRFKGFPAYFKREILDFCYDKWIGKRFSSLPA